MARRHGPEAVVYNNTDPTRKVRFLPYGIAVSVLDATESSGD